MYRWLYRHTFYLIEIKMVEVLIAKSLMFFSLFSVSTIVVSLKVMVAGLATVKHAVRRHQGSVSIASKTGKGTTVTLVLPV